jgi:hypothetical protein
MAPAVSGPFKDEWNPTEDEIRAWARTPAEVPQDWELALSDHPATLISLKDLRVT